MMVVVDALQRGRELYSSRAWLAAYESLSAADHATPPGARDLELLATSAYMIGREGNISAPWNVAIRRT